MLVTCTFRPMPWSWYSRWPQYGIPFVPEPCLHPPPTPKVPLLPRQTIHPPPVRKSHGGSVAQAFTGGAVVPSTSTPTTAAVRRPPAASADSSLLIVLFL